MIRDHLRLLLGVALAAAMAAGPAHALLEDNLSSLTSDQTEGYLGPLARGLSGSLNSGIFRSGDVPLAGVSLSLDIRGAYVSFSDDDRVFDTPAIPGYSSTEAPTVIGDVDAVTVNHESVPGLQFTYPGGFDMGNFAAAVPQLTIGNILGTRAMIRWLSLSLGDEDLGDFSFFGLGGQHSISQYLPGLPVDLAVGVMWQKFSIGDDVVDASALAFNVTGSRRFGTGVTVEPFVGLGLDSFRMDATYDTDDDESISVEFDRENDVHLALGAGLNLPGVKVHAGYDIAATNGFSGGISFGI